MFDMNKVAGNIKTARMKKNMTQMNLADEMGVSYQAVSNWERGNSMPDISKLPELCKILGLSFEELVGERTAETEIAEKLMQEDASEVTLEDMAKVGQLVKPEELEKKAEETVCKNQEKITFSTLISIAPFMDKETLDGLAEQLADVDLRKVSALAPFLSRGALDKIIDTCIQKGNVDGNHVAAVAPFLAKSSVQKLAEYLIASGQANKLVTIAPFMARERVSDLVKEAIAAGDFSIEGIDEVNVNVRVGNGADGEAPELYDLEEDEVAERAHQALERGEVLENYLDYMDEDDVDVLAVKALEAGYDVRSFLDYMTEDGVARLAGKALEQGKEIPDCLDYMSDDAVEQLAFKALAAGQDIERYLDYLDEDVIKELLLRAIRK